MTGLNPLAPAKPHALAARRARQLTHQSSMREKVFEHIFLGQLGAELLARGVEYSELHSTVDWDGFDVLLEAGSIQRHTQLKVMRRGGARADLTVNTRLAMRPSGCVVWLTYDPATRDFCDIRWFGGSPGEPLPDLGDKIAKHTRANSKGVKSERWDHRVLAASRLERLSDLSHLVDRMFGQLPADSLHFLQSRLRHDGAAGPAWLQQAADGDFTAIPEDLAWDDGHALARLMDGYRLLELISGHDPTAFLDAQRSGQQSTGIWPGDAAQLWTTLFLEVRADRLGANEGSIETLHLDQLCRQLRDALIALETDHA